MLSGRVSSSQDFVGTQCLAQARIVNHQELEAMSCLAVIRPEYLKEKYELTLILKI